MARSRRSPSRSRRDFLKQSLVVAGGAAALPLGTSVDAEADTAHASAVDTPTPAPDSTHASQETTAGDEASLATTIAYPRVFTGRQLAMIAFPLGGLGAGSISLGGRGQLRDWEIFNRPDKGNAPNYAFPAIWAQRGADPPVARVLEARLQPPYEGSSGLGARNAPGLQRLETATFTGEYPLAHVALADPHLPVGVTLDAFSPFIPHEEDDSGLPAAILRYRVTNRANEPVRVSIAWAIENMVNTARPRPAGAAPTPDTRVNDSRRADRIEGLLLHNPALDRDDPMAGSFGLWLLDPTRTAVASGTPSTHDASNTGVAKASDPLVTMLRGWPRERWWTSVLRYWDDFGQDGRLGPEAEKVGPVAALCLQRTIAPGAYADYTFLLTWFFPNRTPARCGWQAPKGEEETIIGNHYATRFDDAWSVARYVGTHVDRLERATHAFAQAMRETTLPGAIVDAATANLSTLATQTVFRTKDGAFHGFEGCNDKAGCCMGNCTHVWNYETSTAHLFPAMSRSLRRAAFGYSMDDDGAMRIRQLLPDGRERYTTTAADGQMGQIIKAYLDWRLTGDAATLRDFWPLVKKAIAFAWLDGGWDADRDGVLEGVQHNTYDVEFYGPNPQCGIYYLGALRAAEEMAHAAGDRQQAATYRALFTRGRAWIDEHLFNGEYYVQRVRGVPRDRIRATLRSDMGSDETLTPQYQVGDGCLVDQLVGQCLAEVAGLGPLIDPTHCRTALASIYRYNHRAD
ncbi:MAG TPA: GH116 family glycosyl-hydrolase, partial [Vicinamibacterales bacterium]